LGQALDLLLVLRVDFTDVVVHLLLLALLHKLLFLLHLLDLSKQLVPLLPKLLLLANALLFELLQLIQLLVSLLVRRFSCLDSLFHLNSLVV
jgi:hypothetical protein